MFTQIPLNVPDPQATGSGQDLESLKAQVADLAADYRNLLAALVADRVRLNQAGALAISDALIDGTPIGGTTAAAGAFTTVSASGQITSTLATGTAPLVIASTTKVSNLNVDQVDGGDWASPGTIGSTTANTGKFTTLEATGLITATGGQIKFPATQVASADANTLDDYEEGTWTPGDGSGAGLTFSSVTARYTKGGRGYVLQASLTYPATADGTNASINGEPFTEANYSTGALNYGGTGGGTVAVANGVTVVFGVPGGAVLTNANLSSATVRFSIPCMV